VGAERSSGAGAAVAPAIARIEVPTPFRVGPVNAYLIEDEPLTLVDAGPNAAASLDALESALAALGHGLADIELLVVTHQHVDHQGLAASLVRRSGAELAVLDALAGALADWPAYAERNDELAQGLLRRHGVRPETAIVLRAVARGQHGWGASVTATGRLAPGDRLTLRDRSFEVLHAPGHSPSDTLLWDAESGLMLGGDHLLGHISSNPIIALPLTEPEATAALDGRRPQALPGYLDALRRTAALGPALVLPGHGEPVHDATALIDERLRMHEHRAEHIHWILAARSRTAHEVAREIWGERALAQPFLTLCEVLGHVDLLAADDRAREVASGDVTVLEAL
jgi:glyoxylase-like metal-dependent hydrolase (beta-lactamase superfamily II)